MRHVANWALCHPTAYSASRVGVRLVALCAVFVIVGDPLPAAILLTVGTLAVLLLAARVVR